MWYFKYLIWILLWSPAHMLTYRPRTYIKMLNHSPSATRLAIFGASGYIGKYVVKEAVRRGYNTVAVIRPGSIGSASMFEGATVVEADVLDESGLVTSVFTQPVDVVISCLASRSGVKEDANRIDYQATLNTLTAGIAGSGKSGSLPQFILLSAFCVGKPRLEFQKAKLKMEAALQAAQQKGTLQKYSIVRPTAYFKSLSGQFELVQKGWPFVMFGDGNICRCNPIAEADLASYMLDCVTDSDKWNRVLNVGGPGEGLTMRQQGELLFQVLGREPRFVSAPLGLFDASISALDLLGRFSAKARDAAELARIGQYYAVEDMLTTLPGEKYGARSLRGHYERVLREGQGYDPYTTMLAPRSR